VLDRLIQQAIAQVLTPLFDPRFSPHSYGFRPGRRAHDAIKAAQGYIHERYDWAVGIDLEKFLEWIESAVFSELQDALVVDAQMPIGAVALAGTGHVDAARAGEAELRQREGVPICDGL
jgi:RNA-directed DNA polymerase